MGIVLAVLNKTGLELPGLGRLGPGSADGMLALLAGATQEQVLLIPA